MSRVRRAAAVAALLVVTACADREGPVAPDAPPVVAGPEAAAQNADAAARARHERLARRFALALADDAFRAEVAAALAASTHREGKVHLQAFLDRAGGVARRRLATLAKEPEPAVQADLAAAAPIEIYLPVPAHRNRWRGAAEVLVATAETDRDRPVAFEPSGRRALLSADAPPATPVIALGRAETSFGAPALTACADCIGDEPPSDPASGTSGAIVAPGLYMTLARFNETFEGWMKGSPEFEVHVLGQEGSSSALKSYQCAGEHAGGPYAFDQNQTTWSGRVLLFSKTQLDSYRAQHPGQAYRVFVVEDDDTACQIKTDSTRFEKVITDVEAGIGPISGGFDSTLTVGRAFRAARASWKIFKTVWSWVTTQDDLVGNAVEDVVAREFVSGANWIIRAEQNVTKGAIKLELIGM
ncbi:MAG: hypothetical protein ACRENB_11070 [Gemmatimonadales bacterium]